MIAAQRLVGPLGELRVVEPDAAAQRRPDARQRAHQRGLAATARADDAERLARLELEADVAEQHAPGAWRGHGDLFDLQRRTGAGSSIGASASASATTVSLSRWKAVRAATTPFQLPIARSTGAERAGRGDRSRR